MVHCSVKRQGANISMSLSGLFTVKNSLEVTIDVRAQTSYEPL